MRKRLLDLEPGTHVLEVVSVTPTESATGTKTLECLVRLVETGEVYLDTSTRTAHWEPGTRFQALAGSTTLFPQLTQL